MDTAEPRDVFVAGRVFLDIIFTGMLAAPSGGHEVWTDGMGSSPGGVANLAVACSRLGLSTTLSAAFGGDAYGEYCWKELSESENIDLSHSRRFPDWHSPVTVSLAFDDDRAMVTHEHPPPIPSEELLGEVPFTRAAFADMGVERASWVDTMVANGTKIFADVGWDATERWDCAELRERLAGCHAFVPNSAEAMAYTRTDQPGRCRRGAARMGAARRRDGRQWRGVRRRRRDRRDRMGAGRTCRGPRSHWGRRRVPRRAHGRRARRLVAAPSTSLREPLRRLVRTRIRRRSCLTGLDRHRPVVGPGQVREALRPRLRVPRRRPPRPRTSAR